ncbi:MAG: PKD domain-containing protein, partial [Bacteroidetes bacterium]|nr:PKD domain-containing protein [Bacteroidota bacterium]
GEATWFYEKDALTGNIGYTSNGVFDASDYYKTPLSADGTIRIYMDEMNTGSTTGYVRLYVFDKSGRELLNHIFANRTDVAVGATVYDTVNIYSRGADTIYFRVYADNQSFSYHLRYELTTQSPVDVEPNNSTAEATTFQEKDILQGHVGYTTNGFYDGSDYYKSKLPADGTIRLFLSGTNTGGGAGYLRVNAYDKSGRELLNRIIANNLNVAPDQTVKDTINIYSRGEDMIYYRIYADNQSFSYQFSYQLLDTSANDREPNNRIEEAAFFSEKDMLKGHVGYTTDGFYDGSDFYKTAQTADGTVKILVAGTNTGDGPGYLRINAYDKAGRELLNRIVANNLNVAQYATVYDTVSIYSRGADTLTFRVYADNKSFSYQFGYLLTDTSANDAEPNNSFQEALPLDKGVVKKGHVGYTTNGAYDSHDYYKLGLEGGGILKVYAEGTNTGSVPGYLRVFIYDRIGRELANRILRNNTSVQPGQTIKDTIELSCLPKDSMYMRVYADNQSFAYNVQYEFISLQPKASFDATRTGNTFGYNNTSSNATSYLWNLGNGVTTTNRFPALTTYKPGFYQVSLIAYNNNMAGCNFADTAKISFTIKGVEKFTPTAGGPGMQLFTVYGGGL